MVERRTQRARSDLWAELDAEGEAKVRERLVTAFYGEVGDRRAVVLEWLRSKEVARIEAFQSRQTEAASQAADAAERAGAAVRRQAAEVARVKDRATIALIVATVSATIAIASIIYSFATR
jgi:hypothetical protein